MITYLQRKKFLEVYKKLDGTDLMSACRIVGISRASLYRLMAREPEFKGKIDRIRSKRMPKDIHIAMTLIDKAKMGHLPSIKYFLNQVYGVPQKANIKYLCRKCGDEIDPKDISSLKK